MTYAKEIKDNIISKLDQGVSIQALCTEYGIPRSTLYRWATQRNKEISQGNQHFTVKEYHALQRRVKKLENIISILRTVDCTVRSPLQEKLCELEKLYGQYDVHTLCEALEVSRGTFYNHILRNKRGDAWYHKRREEYRVLIQEVFDEYRQVLGPEKISVILAQRGHRASKTYVEGLMREMGLFSVRTTAKQEYLKSKEAAKKKNILNQQFHAEAPNKIWVSDVTRFKLGNKYYFICVILDLFSRKIISYKISKKNSTQLITSSFKLAWEQRAPEKGLLFHSDRGAQYTSHRFQQMLLEHGVIQSFSHSGRPHDNAVVESFFATMKKEDLYRRNYSSDSSFRNGVDSYITFYNEKRPHQTLKNRTPSQAEEEYWSKVLSSHKNGM